MSIVADTSWTSLLILLAAAFWAGAQNALAGGGSFITLPALMLTGLDARTANIASTIALFPGQVTTGLVGRKLATGAGELSFRALMAISLAGGALGAVLLMATPSPFFARMVPWLVLFATSVFAWGAFLRKRGETHAPIGKPAIAASQFAIAIYGGYFGGGIGFLMMAALTLGGQTVRVAGSTKNLLASAMNASAVAVFVFTARPDWLKVAVVCVGAIAGGALGGVMLKRVNERTLKLVVVLIGITLTIGLFVRAA
jgi:uncharacterized membrane protein YfcA